MEEEGKKRKLVLYETEREATHSLGLMVGLNRLRQQSSQMEAVSLKSQTQEGLLALSAGLADAG